MDTPTVKVIDKSTVHQICSGQVVVTLATAVKELVENSLDAGATNIEVRLKNWGADCLEVVDNGSGVLPENFAALALKHHTSKLNVFSDLVGVETFGFRGEALSSLCALGNLSITTCHKSKNIGAKIDYDQDGCITKQHATARTHGTTVTLQNLFSTLPVRHKEFLRNIKREYARLVQILQGYCVISTAVRISCYTISEKGKKTLTLATLGNHDTRENISNVFGPKQLQALLEFKQINPTAEDCEELGLNPSQLDDNPVFRLTGFVSCCEHGSGRSANDRQYIFINKRPCDMPKLTRLVNEVYHVFNRNQCPFVVLNIDLSKDLVDVNVTPDKRQVFLQQEKLLLATVKSSLKAMFDPGTSNYETNQKLFTQIKLPLTKRNEGETNRWEFSKSIKDRLLAKVSKVSSILKFATKTHEDLAELDDTSKVNKVGDGLDLGSTQQILYSGSVASSEDGLASPDASDIVTEEKQIDLLSGSTDKVYREASTTSNIEKSSSSSVTNGHFSPNHLCSTVGPLRPDGTDELGDEKSQDTKDSVASNGHLNRIPKQNALCSTEGSLPGDPERHLVNENRELPQNEDKLPNNTVGVNEFVEVEKNEEASDLHESGWNKNDVLGKLSHDESVVKYSRDTRGQLKRRRTDENETSEIHYKKVRLDEECTNGVERNARKSITVNFDLQGLRDRMTAGNGSSSKSDNPSGYSRSFRATIAPEHNQRAEEELERHISKEMFSKMEIIGQFNQGFITTKLEDDLFIIDQHASDEKYNFEEQQKNTVIKSQRLICPQSLDLTAVNESILVENLEVFRKNGFDFEIDDEAPVSQRVKLVSLPVSRNWSFGKSDIDELIFMLSDSPGVNYRPSNIRKMFASRACRMSIMVGTSLNDGQMRRIVGHMGEMKHPWNCPHGRPTMRHLVNLNMVRK